MSDFENDYGNYSDNNLGNNPPEDVPYPEDDQWVQRITRNVASDNVNAGVSGAMNGSQYGGMNGGQYGGMNGGQYGGANGGRYGGMLGSAPSGKTSGRSFTTMDNRAREVKNAKVLGVLSIVMSFCCVPFLGAVLGAIGLAFAKGKQEAKASRILCIIGIITSILVAGSSVAFYLYVEHKAGEDYGSSADVFVIRKYMKALDQKEEADARRCYMKSADVKFGPIWDENGTPDYEPSHYDWDTEVVSISAPVSMEIKEYSAKYNVIPTAMNKYTVKDLYYYDGEYGWYSFTFVTCEYMGRYYILDVSENGPCEEP